MLTEHNIRALTALIQMGALDEKEQNTMIEEIDQLRDLVRDLDRCPHCNGTGVKTKRSAEVLGLIVEEDENMTGAE